MGTLLLQLTGPMQSWGVQSRFTERDTGAEPSKSGIAGLLCAAQGLNRVQADEFLGIFNRAGVSMGVRVDREGTVRYDFQTAQDIRKADADRVNLETKSGVGSSVSRRYYLADALFLVGLGSDDLCLLETLYAALSNPTWPLYLGRKAYLPGIPVWIKDGLKKDMGLFEALSFDSIPYLGRNPCPNRVRLVIEDVHGELVRPDQPISFVTRRFAPRRITIRYLCAAG